MKLTGIAFDYDLPVRHEGRWCWPYLLNEDGTWRELVPVTLRRG